MKARLVRIGNSRGVRLPKALIAEAQLTENVELRVADGTIVIAPAKRPRDGWAEDARKLRDAGGDELIGGDASNRFDREEWKW